MKECSTTQKGTNLENEVAEIYRNLEGVTLVIQNRSIMGIQIDVYVEIEGQDGIKNRYAIDAKNYDANVNADRARKCITDFNVLRSGNKIDKGIIVAAKGFTKDANAAVIESGNVPLLLADLRMRALDFSPYLNKWIERFENEEMPRIVKYISLTSRNIDNVNLGNLDHYLFQWLKGASNHITLLGNYGSGKSTTLKYIMNIQAHKYLSNPDKERIPIFIELKGFRQAPKSRQLITDILVNDFGLNINYHKFNEMNEKGKFLIILDGFDEMADKVLDGLPNEHFEELSAFACEQGKVVLSSRTHYFRDPEQLFEVYKHNDLLARVESKKGYEIVFINNFTELDINEYLKAYFDEEWEQYKNIIKGTYDLRSLAEVPILLSMIVQTIPEMKKKGIRINRPAIYEVFTDKWLQRDNWRRALHKTDRLIFCKQLALYFYVNQINYVHWSDLPKIIKKYYEDKIKTQTDLDIFDSDVRTSNFLKRAEDSGQYSFVHRSFMEYFVARCFCDNIQNKASNGLDQLQDITKSKVIYEFLLDMVEQKHIDIMVNDIKKSEGEDYSKLMSEKKGRKSSRLYSNPESLGNCVYLLAQKGHAFNNIALDSAKMTKFEFENISFDGASLKGASFKNCKLVNVSFNNAILSYADFNGAVFRNVHFNGASLDKVDFRGALLDGATISEISSSKYWGSAKLEENLRKRIESAYSKPSETKHYAVEK